jgi:deoxyribodipyrimidine photo-lyase
MNPIPNSRRTLVNRKPVKPAGSFVLYWMTHTRRIRSNFALQRAIEWANKLKRPLVVFEPLSISLPWSSQRTTEFIAQGMRERIQAMKSANVTYLPWIEPQRDQGKHLLKHLARQACLVVTDDSCSFLSQKMMRSGANQVECSMEAVESDTVVPTRRFDRIFKTAASFRRAVHKLDVDDLLEFPEVSPLAAYHLGLAWVDFTQLAFWPTLAQCPIAHGHSPTEILDIDQDVRLCTRDHGGEKAAQRALERFLETDLLNYSEARKHPDDNGGSKLSAFLHMGVLSTHDILGRILEKEQWNPSRINMGRVGSREGWWGVSTDSENFLDQLIVWRELGWNGARHDPHFGSWEGIPDWARNTLNEHQGDPRPYYYSMATLEESRTDDPLWNAAQRELVRTGHLHNYLRMVWGKRVIEWSKTPEEAFARLIHLNNKYALDGRDPNSSSGISWVFGKFDRAWGPERPIFGKVRYMSSLNTRRKLRLNNYLSRFEQPEGRLRA